MLMERRDFLKKACGTCAAAGLSTLFMSTLIESCAAPVSFFKTTASDNKVNIPLSEFGATNFKLVRVNKYNYDIAVLKNGSDFSALLLMCTHAGQALTKTGSGFFCPLHGSRFSQTGDVEKGPATTPLQHLAVRTDNQQVIITLNPEHYSS